MAYFSIIIPVYNSQNTINRLIDSILNQQFQDYEIIIVNDGSKDNSGTVILEYQDSRIKYYYKDNGGISDARNYGLDRANGKYILFADADDFLEENALDVLYKATSDNCDLICFNYYNYYNKAKRDKRLLLNNEIITINNSEAIINYLNYTYINKYANAVWNKVYKKEVVDNIKFSTDLKIGEDLIFNIEYFSKINSLKSIDNALYNYYIAPTSTMRSFRKNNIQSIKAYIKEIDRILDDNNLDIKEYITSFYLSNFWGVVVNELKNKSYTDAKNNLKDYINYLKQLPKIGFKDLYNNKLKVYYLLIKTKMCYIVFALMYKIKK